MEQIIENYKKKLDYEVQKKFASAFKRKIKPNTYQAITKIYRHFFIPKIWFCDEKKNEWSFKKFDYDNPAEELLKEIYVDTPLVVAVKDKDVLSTCSQPSLVAYMIDIADISVNDRVLEIGTGSGYNSSIISEIVGQDNIITTEIESNVASQAKENIKRAGKNIKVIVADGGIGYKEKAPYESIIVTCATPDIPWYTQLSDGGTVIIPLLTRGLEMLCKFVKKGNIFEGTPLLSVRFLTFTGTSSIMSDYKKNIKSLGHLLKRAEQVEDLSQEISELSSAERFSFLFYLSFIEKDAIYYDSDEEEVESGYGIWKRTPPYGISLMSKNKVIHWGDNSTVEKLKTYFTKWKVEKLLFSDYKITAYPHYLWKETPETGIIVDKKFNKFILEKKH